VGVWEMLDRACLKVLWENYSPWKYASDRMLRLLGPGPTNRQIGRRFGTRR
jgi:hypothetical protein